MTVKKTFILCILLISRALFAAPDMRETEFTLAPYFGLHTIGQVQKSMTSSELGLVATTELSKNVAFLIRLGRTQMFNSQDLRNVSLFEWGLQYETPLTFITPYTKTYVTTLLASESDSNPTFSIGFAARIFIQKHPNTQLRADIGDITKTKKGIRLGLEKVIVFKHKNFIKINKEME